MKEWISTSSPSQTMGQFSFAKKWQAGNSLTLATRWKGSHPNLTNKEKNWETSATWRATSTFYSSRHASIHLSWALGVEKRIFRSLRGSTAANESLFGRDVDFFNGILIEYESARKVVGECRRTMRTSTEHTEKAYTKYTVDGADSWST